MCHAAGCSDTSAAEAMLEANEWHLERAVNCFFPESAGNLGVRITVLYALCCSLCADSFDPLLQTEPLERGKSKAKFSRLRGQVPQLNPAYL